MVLFNIRNSYILRPKLPKTPIFLVKILLYSSYILGKTWLTACVMATDDDVFYRRVGGVPAGCLREVLGGCDDQLHAAGAPWHRVSP